MNYRTGFAVANVNLFYFTAKYHNPASGTVTVTADTVAAAAGKPSAQLFVFNPYRTNITVTFAIVLLVLGVVPLKPYNL